MYNIIEYTETKKALDLISYNDYCTIIESFLIDDERLVLEGLLSKTTDIVKKSVTRTFEGLKSDIIKVANDIGCAKSEVVKLFKEPSLFHLLKGSGYSLRAVTRGITTFTGLLRNGLSNTLHEITNNGGFEYMSKGAEYVDKYVDQHPILQKLRGYAIAGLLYYTWTKMTFIGDFKQDFDSTLSLKALKGELGFKDAFFSDDGKMHTALYISGVSMPDVSAAWMGSLEANTGLMLAYTAANHILKSERHQLWTENIVKKIEKKHPKLGAAGKKITEHWKNHIERLKSEGKELPISQNISKSPIDKKDQKDYNKTETKSKEEYVISGRHAGMIKVHSYQTKTGKKVNTYYRHPRKGEKIPQVK
jgi:hypothetical protein